MKNLLAFVLLGTILTSANSQTISPVQTGEFCPNIEYTFTASIPKTYQGIIGVNSASVTQLPASPVGSSFTFKGKFGDANQKQSFRVNYTDGTFFDFEFKKIKSLFYSATATTLPPCNVIKPNQIQPVIFPRCQVSSATISFPNIQWFTTFENPEVCFGSVTEYEYQLPANWSIGSNTSNGSNWIEGGNSVVVTSDFSTGNGVDIKIRASNKTCGSGLANNGPVSTVRISRPRPTLSITGDNFICSASKNYTVSGTLTPGSTVCWTSSNTNVATVASSNCATSTSVTYITSGVITLTATITDCIETYPITTDILVGAAISGYYRIHSDYHNYGIFNTLYNNNSAIWLPANKVFGIDVFLNSPGIQSATWSRASTSYPFLWNTAGTFLSFSGTSGAMAYVERKGIFDITVQTSCGTFNGTYNWPVVVQGWGYFRITTSPNPAHDLITLDISEESPEAKALDKEENVIIEIYTFNQSNLIKQWSFKNDQNKFNLNVANLQKGNYIIVVKKGKFKESKQVFIDK